MIGFKGIKIRFQISFIFHFYIYTQLIILKWSCSGQIHISIIKKSHKILEKLFDRFCVAYGRSLEIIENYAVEKWVVRIGTDTLKMVCTDTKNKIIQ